MRQSCTAGRTTSADPHLFITLTSLEGRSLVLLLHLQQQRRVLCLYHTGHVLPVAVQHLLPQLHPLVPEHQALPYALLAAQLEVQTGQLVIFEFLLLLHHQRCGLDRMHSQLVPVFSRKDVAEPLDLVLQLAIHQDCQLLMREMQQVEEGDVGLTGHFNLVSLRVFELYNDQVVKKTSP